MKKRLSAFLVIVLCIALAGCGNSHNSAIYDATTEEYAGAWDGGYSNGFYEESYSEYKTDNYDTKIDTPNVADTSRKLIKNYNVDIETENFDELIPAIEARVNELGGYIESLNTYYGDNVRSRGSRYSNMTIRVPKNKADEFLMFVGNSSNITRQSLDVSDVTLSYVDTASRRDSYIVERDRLLALLEKADNLEDILTIESRLSEVRYALESMESQLRTMDNKVDYSTVQLSVSEVIEYTEPAPETYGQRVSASFRRGIKNFVEGVQDFSIWFVGAIPVLILLALLLALAIIIAIKIDKRSKEKAKARREQLKKEMESKTPDMPSKDKKEDKKTDDK